MFPTFAFPPAIIPFQSLLPHETARSTVRHQVQCPWDFNRHQRTVVNYANHWTLLSATVQHRSPSASNIRIGSLIRNKITQLLLLDLDYCSSSGSDGGMPQGCQPGRFDSPVPFEGRDERLTEKFVARSAAATMHSSAAESHPEGSRCSCCRNCGHRSDCEIAPIMTARSKEQAVQQLVVMGRRATRHSCQIQINDSIPCGCCQARM